MLKGKQVIGQRRGIPKNMLQDMKAKPQLSSPIGDKAMVETSSSALEKFCDYGLTCQEESLFYVTDSEALLV